MSDKLQVTALQAQAMEFEASRRIANALSMFRPSEHQEQFFLAFERDKLDEILLGGGNRAGKTLCASVAIASAALNHPITFRDGSKHSMRPARWMGEPLKIWIVGFDWSHIGKTLHRLLFKKGGFRVIKDKDSKKYRCWNPDKDRYADTRPSPALIRNEDLQGGEEGIAWENKKENQISKCVIKYDETDIQFFPSTGALPVGDPAHIVWIDEAIADGGWYTELLARLFDYDGRLLWTAWPDTVPSDEMSSLQDEAAAQKAKADGNQTSFHFILSGDDNRFTAGDGRDRKLKRMPPDVRAARGQGLNNNDRWKMYPRFNKYLHRVYGPDDSKDDLLAKTIREKGVPCDWTRYLILDPGTANPAILFVAIPPPKFGDYVVPYDELDLPYTSARPLAEAAAAKAGITAVSAGHVFEEFIADFHACRVTPMGFDGTIGENYEKEFARVGLKSRRRGTRFTPGSDNVTTRIMRVQGMMHVNAEGFPRLRIVSSNCPTLIRQLEIARWAQDKFRNPIDKPSSSQRLDMSTCLEYFASRDDCGYFMPPPQPTQDKRTREYLMNTIKLQLGRSIDTKAPDRSVYCGAGAVEALEYM